MKDQTGQPTWIVDKELTEELTGALNVELNGKPNYLPTGELTEGLAEELTQS